MLKKTQRLQREESFSDFYALLLFTYLAFSPDKLHSRYEVVVVGGVVVVVWARLNKANLFFKGWS